MATYTVAYDANGGSGSIANQGAQVNSYITLASSGFTRQYYHMNGWKFNATTNLVAYALGAQYTQGTAGNTILYCAWQPDTPGPVTNLTATRQFSDSKVSLTWTRAAGAGITYAGIWVERSVDGGSWANVTDRLSGTATSYADTTTSANHYYRYRVRVQGYGDNSYSSYATSGYVYMTPAAPASVSGTQAESGGSEVLLELDNSNVNGVTTIDGYAVEMSSDSSAWVSATIADWETGVPMPYIIVEDAQGSHMFRVANKRGTLQSPWTVSNRVVALTPPNAPTLVSPSSGAVVGASSSTQSVTFQWLHNPKDGTAQTGAQLRYKVSSASSWTTVTVSNSTQEKAVSLSRGNEYVWQVRTKGSYSDYGAWSGSQTFALYAPPTVSLTQPSATITNMPIDYAVSFTDSKGTFASGTLTILLDGEVKYSEPIDSTLSGTITADEWLPSSGNEYEFVVTAKSSTTLTGSTPSYYFNVAMGEPNHGTLEIANDSSTGYANLTVGWDASTGAVSAVSASLYRVVGGVEFLLADGMADGAGYVDKYAPLNTPYVYKVYTVSEGNAWTSVPFDNEIVSDRWFAIWDGGEKSAWAEWNPKGSYKLTRPQKKRVHYVGREYPVSYDGTALDETHSITFTVVDMDSWSNGFIDLMHDGGRGVYKSVDGKVFWADFEITNTPNYTSITKIGTVSIDITRIEGDAV